MAKKGDVSPMMWMLLGLLVLIAVIGVVLSLKSKSTGLLGSIRGLFG